MTGTVEGVIEDVYQASSSVDSMPAHIRKLFVRFWTEIGQLICYLAPPYLGVFDVGALDVTPDFAETRYDMLVLGLMLGTL